jgi:hypothetical protein
MAKAAEFYNEIMREAVARVVKRVEVWRDYILADGYPPGTEPQTKEEEAQYLARMAPLIPQLAQQDPERAKEMMARIDKLIGGEK